MSNEGIDNSWNIIVVQYVKVEVEVSMHGIDSAGQTTCIFVVPELISFTWFKPNPRYDSKCEYTFYYQETETCPSEDKILTF